MGKVNFDRLNGIFEDWILNSGTIMKYKEYEKEELVSLRVEDEDSGLYTDHFLTCLWLTWLFGRNGW